MRVWPRSMATAVWMDDGVKVAAHPGPGGNPRNADQDTLGQSGVRRNHEVIAESTRARSRSTAMPWCSRQGQSDGDRDLRDGWLPAGPARSAGGAGPPPSGRSAARAAGLGVSPPAHNLAREMSGWLASGCWGGPSARTTIRRRRLCRFSVPRLAHRPARLDTVHPHLRWPTTRRLFLTAPAGSAPLPHRAAPARPARTHNPPSARPRRRRARFSSGDSAPPCPRSRSHSRHSAGTSLPAEINALPCLCSTSGR